MAETRKRKSLKSKKYVCGDTDMWGRGRKGVP